MLLLFFLVAVLAAGCGADTPAAPPGAAAPQPYSARSSVNEATSAVRPATLRRPIAIYRGYVRAQLGRMLGDVGALRAAAAAGNLTAARAAWLRAYRRYQRIGAAYGAFGALGRAIDTTPAGLPGGVHSRRFTGLHRVEYALWAHHSALEALVPAARLARAVADLRGRVPRVEIAPLDYVLRAHEVLEDSLRLELSGQASPWSQSALTALQANVGGTRVVLATLAPIVRQRDPAVLRAAHVALARLSGALAGVRRGGALPRWDALPQRQREEIDGLTAAAAERLSFVPELVDPRRPRPTQRAIGTSP